MHIGPSVSIAGFTRPQVAGGGSFAPDISTALYDSKSKSVATEATVPNGIFMNSAGSKLYVIDLGGTDSVYQYTLSTPNDLATATYDALSFSTTAQDAAPTGLCFNADQSKMWTLGDATNTVYQYTLFMPGDVSSASYDSKSFSVAGQESNPQGVVFNSDQSTMWILGWNTDTVYQYTLSTPGDVSTASYASKSFSVAAQEGSPWGLQFNADQSAMYIVGSGSGNKIYQYALSTPGDISTASYDEKSFDVGLQDGTPRGIFFSSDYLKLWYVGIATDTVYQYSLAA